jgi:hypothetical protein
MNESGSSLQGIKQEMWMMLRAQGFQLRFSQVSLESPVGVVNRHRCPPPKIKTVIPRQPDELLIAA